MLRDICTLDDTKFGELESVSLHRLSVSALLHVAALFSLDQDEMKQDSALFLLHPPHHIPALYVGLPNSIALSHSEVFSGGGENVMVTFWNRCPL